VSSEALTHRPSWRISAPLGASAARAFDKRLLLTVRDEGLLATHLFKMSKNVTA
jgi:hypothetical protein